MRGRGKGKCAAIKRKLESFKEKAKEGKEEKEIGE